MRILSQPRYRNSVTTAVAIATLQRSIASSDHAFWSDDVSMTDSAVFDHTHNLGPKLITDLYLLALAARHGGRLVSSDRTIPAAAVRIAKPEHLVVL